jgi:hypothetical protein
VSSRARERERFREREGGREEGREGVREEGRERKRERAKGFETALHANHCLFLLLVEQCSRSPEQTANCKPLRPGLERQPRRPSQVSPLAERDRTTTSTRRLAYQELEHESPAVVRSLRAAPPSGPPEPGVGGRFSAQRRSSVPTGPASHRHGPRRPVTIRPSESGGFDVPTERRWRARRGGRW